MINLNVKAENRILLNKKITRFYNDLIENLNYIICNRIKPIDNKIFLDFEEVNNFAEKLYVKNKYRKNFEEEIEKMKQSIGDSFQPLSATESDRLDDTFDILINAYSDNLQTELGKKTTEISKKSPEQVSNFKQALYNQITHQVQIDFESQKLPDNYKLTIKQIEN